MRSKAHTLQNVPENHTDGNDVVEIFEWESPRRKFTIVCDCKPLVEVAMGVNPLNDCSLQPGFRRLTRSLANLILGGLLPMQSHVDPILWRSRDSNKIADHLVNVTMDTKQSWEELAPPGDPRIDLTEANFVMHCDGGTRVGTCSAATRVLEAHTQTHR